MIPKEGLERKDTNINNRIHPMKINPLTNPTGDHSAVRFTTEYSPINPEIKRG